MTTSPLKTRQGRERALPPLPVIQTTGHSGHAALEVRQLLDERRTLLVAEGVGLAVEDAQAHVLDGVRVEPLGLAHLPDGVELARRDAAAGLPVPLAIGWTPIATRGAVGLRPCAVHGHPSRRPRRRRSLGRRGHPAGRRRAAREWL